MPARALFCTHCNGPRIERTREDLADAIRQAAKLAAGADNPHLALVAQLVWFESELRGHCTNCTFAAATELFVAASIEVVVVTAPANESHERAEPDGTPSGQGMRQCDAGNAAYHAQVGGAAASGAAAPVEPLPANVLPLRKRAFTSGRVGPAYENSDFFTRVRTSANPSETEKE